MGSKKPIINFIIGVIDDIHQPENWICDLFSGSCSISAGLRKEYNFISNDIQDYSRILAQTYFSDLSKYEFDELNEQIELSANNHYMWFKENYPDYFFDFSKIVSLEDFAEKELKQRALLKNEEFNQEFHLFTKCYSGT
ncbi:MAG TPA: DNA adenine methylase, partial [Chitinophagaceae bacterium]|nr:DNA adenine methylase [Chitinophagaceae bacterium]